MLPDLSTGTNDRAAALLRALSNAVPIVGGAIAEVFTAIIPNQQIDRLQIFLEALACRLEQFELTQAAITDDRNAALVEEGWYRARETSQEERIENIARCVADEISSEDRNQLHKSRILGRMHLTKTLNTRN